MGRIVLRAFLVLLLGAALYWLLRLRSEAPAEPELGAYGAPEWAAQADRVVFVSAKDSIVVERRGEEFSILEPVVDRADPTRILQTIQAARRLDVIRVLPGEDPGAFGLDPPEHRLHLDGGGGRWTLAFGDSVPIGSRVYARVETEPGPEAGGAVPDPRAVLVLREFSARRNFYPPVDDLRSPQSFSFRSPVVDSIHVLTAAGPLRAARESRDSWRALEPVGLELDPLPIHRALRHLRSPTIQGYEARGVGRGALGLDPPRATWIAFQSGQAETVGIGALTAEGEAVYVEPAGRDVVARMAADFYRDLVGGWPALASRRLSWLLPEEIARIEFPGGPAAYARADSGWVQDPGGSREVEQEALELDLRNLLALQWEAYPTEPLRPPPGSGRVEVRLVLREDTGPEAAASAGPHSARGPETITLARVPGDSLILARSSRRDLWGRVPPEAYTAWAYRRDSLGAR